jgi:hypothetical protein
MKRADDGIENSVPVDVNRRVIHVERTRVEISITDGRRNGIIVRGRIEELFGGHVAIFP